MANPNNNVPPPAHTTRDHAQVMPPAGQAGATVPSTTSALEFAETTSVSLEWRLTGLRAMYESSKGDSKSKCIKSAIFGDPDNLWEVLWYPNSGVQGGEYASLYLSCVPTQQERDLGVGNKWIRKGLWWFRFEVKVPEERSGKFTGLASKDASDHTFAVKTANWGWQQFAKRDQLFLHPSVVAADTFTIVCTISAQPQPPAGYWLGMGNLAGMRASALGAPPNGAWYGGDGASGGVAGGTMAAGGPKRVVPKDLVSAVGDMLDDPLYSDIEFIIPAPSLAARGLAGERPPPRRIYANKKLLSRCEYFEAMFHGGFGEVEGMSDIGDYEDDFDVLSDSDEEDEADDLLSGPYAAGTTSTTRDVSPVRASFTRTASGETDTRMPDLSGDESMEGTSESEADGATAVSSSASAAAATDIVERNDGEGGDDAPAEHPMRAPQRKKVPPTPTAPPRGTAPAHLVPVLGPKKTRAVVRDAAWSTWWAVLYWLYTDTIYFAPLSSSFTAKPARHSRSGSASGIPTPEPRSRREWIAQWLVERGLAAPDPTGLGLLDPHNSPPTGPRPVSAKAVYRLADKLDLPALKLRAFQHICSQLTAANIPAEVFSRFSSTFEDVRKVQVAFFLKHWAEIKKSETMQNIWKQIRDGKHVGFEEVWPLIVGQLDFRPS